MALWFGRYSRGKKNSAGEKERIGLWIWEKVEKKQWLNIWGNLKVGLQKKF